MEVFDRPYPLAVNCPLRFTDADLPQEAQKPRIALDGSERREGSLQGNSSLATFPRRGRTVALANHERCDDGKSSHVKM